MARLIDLFYRVGVALAVVAGLGIVVSMYREREFGPASSDQRLRDEERFNRLVDIHVDNVRDHYEKLLTEERKRYERILEKHGISETEE